MKRKVFAVLAAMVVVTGFVGAEDFPAYLKMNGTTIIGCDKASVPADLVIPNGVKIIDVNAFRDCERLTSVTIPSSVMFIGHNAFNNCDGLTRVTISEGVRGIGEHAFANCWSLADVTIPKSVTKIWSGAFLCDLTTVRYNGTKTEWKRVSKGTDDYVVNIEKIVNFDVDVKEIRKFVGPFYDQVIVRCTDGEIMWWE